MVVRLVIFVTLAIIFLLDLCLNKPEIHFLGHTSSLNVRFIMCHLEVHHPIYSMTKGLSHQSHEMQYDEMKLKTYFEQRIADKKYAANMKHCKKEALHFEWALFMMLVAF